MLSFRNAILLPLFAVVALLSLSSRDPSKMAQYMSAASLDTKNKLSEHDDFYAKDHDTLGNHTLDFLQHCWSELLRPTSCGVTSNAELWAENLTLRFNFLKNL